MLYKFLKDLVVFLVEWISRNEPKEEPNPEPENPEETEPKRFNGIFLCNATLTFVG